MTSHTLTRASSLEALAAIRAAMRLAFDDDDRDRELHAPLAAIQSRLVDELGIAPDGMDLGDDPEWVAIERRAGELELEIRLGLLLA